MSKKKEKKVKVNARFTRKKRVVKKTCNVLKDDFKNLQTINLDDPEHLELLKCMSEENQKQLGENEEKYN